MTPDLVKRACFVSGPLAIEGHGSIFLPEIGKGFLKGSPMRICSKASDLANTAAAVEQHYARFGSLATISGNGVSLK